MRPAAAHSRARPRVATAAEKNGAPGRNVRHVSVLSGVLMARCIARRGLRGAFVLALTAALAAAATPAAAHVSVFVGGVVGFPPYPIPYPYAYPHYPAPYPYAVEEVPPPGWVAGHWEVRSDPWGRPVRVWVPGHLR